MRISELANNMLKYLPVIAVLAATVVGLVVGKALYPPSLDSRTPPPMIIPGAEAPCGSSNIYTSLPPKCKTLEGEFMPLPGPSLYLLVPPEGK